jgi:hypothetical protein
MRARTPPAAAHPPPPPAPLHVSSFAAVLDLTACTHGGAPTHYHASPPLTRPPPPSPFPLLQVSSFVAVLDKDLGDRVKTSEVDLAPLLGLTYGAMFRAEAERRIKAVPLAFYQQAPSKVFDVNCEADFPCWQL